VKGVIFPQFANQSYFKSRVVSQLMFDTLW